MSEARFERSAHENGTPTGALQSDLSSRSSKEFPSGSLPDIKATTKTTQPLKESDLSKSEPQPQYRSANSRAPSDLRSQSHDRSSVSSRGTSPAIPFDDSNAKIRQLIARSFSPRVAIYASEDSEEFVREKGFEDGLLGLIRPYGERLQGKVIIRDSIGGSKAWDDFSIRFVGSQSLRCSTPNHANGESRTLDPSPPVRGLQSASVDKPFEQSDGAGRAIDQVLEHTLLTSNGIMGDHRSKRLDWEKSVTSQFDSSHLYPVYLRKILSSIGPVPYETFSHPVACLIAVSSHHPAPIEALRQLYAETGHGNNRTIEWIGTECLRYYVLIHDEENDDITKSTALFDLMKRHFGLHCHLLRLRSSQCVETDDDNSRVPECEWLSANEEIEKKRAKDYTDDLEVSEHYTFESDVTAVRAMLREMVTQSILPFMENRVITWNDQVASRRRGLSGRFMSLSKRWAGFGSSKSATSGSTTTLSSSNSNYDHRRGFYPPESPEATMRQLGDYAFMLRDWKLAYSTYEFLRTDFSHDKAWSYHAAVNEMAAITSLLNPQTMNSKSRSETIDQMLDTAAYSYLTRCSLPANVVRCLTVTIELLRHRGPSAVDDASRWGGRLLELGILTPFAQAITTEIMADCYETRTKASSLLLSGRSRQAALWNVLASESWLKVDKLTHARARLEAARRLYSYNEKANAGPLSASMQPLWLRMDHALRDDNIDPAPALIDLENIETGLEEGTLEKVEQLDGFNRKEYMSEVDAEGFTTQDAGRPRSDTSDETQSNHHGFE